MSYQDLRALGVQFRPIDTWPGEQTRGRRHAQFSSSIGSTMKVLGQELRQLNAKHVVVQIAMSEADFRNDGIPYANARATHPGIVIAFESKFGPLKFAVDTFWAWEDNLRAVALGMEALRKVDRYGVTKRGEQYTGWKALPQSTDPTQNMTLDQARAYLDDVWGGDATAALRATHPDVGGDPDEFRKVQRARELLRGSA